MSGVTAEQARAAAEVLRVFQFTPNVWTQGESETMGRSARILDDIAKRMEREQAEKAKRDKRVDRLSDDAIESIWPGIDFPPVREMSAVKSTVRYLLDRYPSLLDETGATS